MIIAPTTFPTRITQLFGINKAYYSRWGLQGHPGIDLAGPVAGYKGGVIIAPYDGVVTHAGWDGDYGITVRIVTDRSNNGLRREIVLAHLDSLNNKIAVGKRIALGDPVGIMGTTGVSSGIHLHLGLRYLLDDGLPKDFGNGYLGYIDFYKYLLPPPGFTIL